MAKNVRISDALYRLAQVEAMLESRSIAQQLEYWAKRGLASTRAGAGQGAAGSLDATLAASRQLDIVDVQSGRIAAEALHFVPGDIVRGSELVFPGGYQAS